MERALLEQLTSLHLVAGKGKHQAIHLVLRPPVTPTRRLATKSRVGCFATAEPCQ
jgi:hypothetical protein